VGVACLVVGAVVAWAVLTVLRPAEDPLEVSGFTYVTVAEGEVGSSINLNTVAAWSPVPAGSNQAAGVVTAVKVKPGDQVKPGAVLYTVDLRPVVIAAGAVPAFRDIGAGTHGADVRQLQRLLAAVGVYKGKADGKVGAGTVSAIKAWQKKSGFPVTGTVARGDVIFVPALPTRVSLDSEVIARGNTVSGGEKVVRTLPASPRFTVPVTDSQAGMMPAGTVVQIASPDGDVWDAVAGEQTTDEQSGTVTVALTGPDGGVICGEQCGQVPVTGEARLGSQIITVPTVQGLVVPSAALITDADGKTAVIDKKGTRHPVTVTASARGMSVIDGVDAGLDVHVPATNG